MFFLGYFMDDISDKALRGNVINVHKLIGLTILALMILRTLWALINRKPDLPAGSKTWERWTVRAVHLSLYLVLLIMPLIGWIGSVAGGWIPHLGNIQFNLPIEKNKALSDLAFDTHNTLAIIIIVLVSLHALAALYHFFIKKDNILQRMWITK